LVRELACEESNGKQHKKEAQLKNRQTIVAGGNVVQKSVGGDTRTWQNVEKGRFAEEREKKRASRNGQEGLPGHIYRHKLCGLQGKKREEGGYLKKMVVGTYMGKCENR